MSTRLFDKGRENLAGVGNWTADTTDAVLVNLNTTDVTIKAITGATNATPIVLTATAHGFANGDIIVVQGVGGNTAANGTFQCGGVAANTINLLTVNDAQNTTGNGAYTSGGTAIDLTLTAALTDVDAGIINGPISVTGKAQTLGVLSATNPAFTSVTGTAHAVFFRDNTTSTPLIFVDGKTLVTVSATAASSATTVAVEKLAGPIANGTALVFSNGITATLTAGANAGDRTLTVSALSGGIAAGHTSDAPTTGSGLPFTASGGNYTFSWASGIIKI